MEPPPSQQHARKRPDYDQALKRMLTRAHDGFLELVAPDVRWLGERSTELPAVARRADLVWEVETAQGEQGLLHIELQTQPGANMGERMAEYGVRLWLRDHLPIRSMVVFLLDRLIGGAFGTTLERASGDGGAQEESRDRRIGKAFESGRGILRAG